MSVKIGDSYSLMDRTGRSLGRVGITENLGDFLCGTLEKSSDFALYEELFKEHEDCANHQRLRLIDGIETRIAAIGAYLYHSEDGSTLAIKDLQIMNSKDICFRLAEVP